VHMATGTVVHQDDGVSELHRVHMATGTVVHQDDAVSELHRVQDVLNAMQCH